MSNQGQGAENSHAAVPTNNESLNLTGLHRVGQSSVFRGSSGVAFFQRDSNFAESQIGSGTKRASDTVLAAHCIESCDVDAEIRRPVSAFSSSSVKKKRKRKKTPHRRWSDDSP